uniref:Connector enhancer of kinase suppressor of Ras 1 n=1 Tax=Denticeps clupeoides TaxID=299321 RepID=A0AAY4A9L2_9TELE
MESIASWSAERVGDWFHGLDSPLQQYCFSEWKLTGMDLLQLTSTDLEQLGVHKIGHQELIMEAVEKLCALAYNMKGENLRSLTEKLHAVSHSLQLELQGRWRVKSYNGHSTNKLPLGVLYLVLDIISSAKGLLALLNRHQLAQPSGYAASKSVVTLCRDLGAAVQKETTAYEKEKDLISICRQLMVVCEEILSNSPEDVLSHTSQLESVELVPACPGDKLGIEITSTGSSNHYVTGTAAESPAEASEKILAGDEVIQVNDQIVVGWSRGNLVKKLQENPSGVTLILKKCPVSLKRRERAPDPKKDGEEEGEKRHTLIERVAASVRSLSFRSAVHGPEARQRAGQGESELSSGALDGRVSFRARHKGSAEDLTSVLASERGRGSPTLPAPERDRRSVSSCPEMVGHKEEKEGNKWSTKGTRTAMSRRRVSCRELGRPDCDGWLWKKRKDANVFMTQKWQRLWFVLKGPTLYWYTSQQEEKAEGLVKVSSYNIESAGEHKRKFVFKMSHPRFQNFIFAAENVNDMSKWINSLIPAIQKYKKLHQNTPDSEAECYSETETEEENPQSPLNKKKIYSSSTLPYRKGKKTRPLAISPGNEVTSPPKGAPVDEMGVFINQLKEDGVTPTGQEQPLTHDHFRRSFIRRNKNPVINEKAHHLRTLQSTLKAKEAELHLINKVLEDMELTSPKFQQWKECNEHLFQEIEKLAAQKEQGKDVAARKVGVATATEGGGSDDDGADRPALSDGEQLVDRLDSQQPPVTHFIPIINQEGITDHLYNHGNLLSRNERLLVSVVPRLV